MQPKSLMTDSVPAHEIRTARLLIRCKRPADALLLKRAVDSSLGHLRAWMPWAMHEPSELWVIEERIARFQREFQSGQDRSYAIFNAEETEILGGIGLHPGEAPDTMELGYWLRADATGQGLATEAAAALTQAAFNELGATARRNPLRPHEPAQRTIPERLGFRLEKILTLRHTLTPTGDPRDTMVWAMHGVRSLKRAVLVQRLDVQLLLSGKAIAQAAPGVFAVMLRVVADVFLDRSPAQTHPPQAFRAAKCIVLQAKSFLDGHPLPAVDAAVRRSMPAFYFHFH